MLFYPTEFVVLYYGSPGIQIHRAVAEILFPQAGAEAGTVLETKSNSQVAFQIFHLYHGTACNTVLVQVFMAYYIGRKISLSWTNLWST